MKKVRIYILIFLIFGFFLPNTITIAYSSNGILCSPGSINAGQTGTPPLASVPTYDYGSDGLVRFHFKMLSGWSVVANNFGGIMPFVNTNFYGSSCQYQNTQYYNSSFSIPNIPNLMLKAEPLGTNVFHFVAYDEGTVQQVPFGAPIPNVSATDVVQLSFVVWPNSTAYFYGIGQESIFTPTVSVTNENFVQNNGQTPVLIVPGVMGTDLFKGSTKLWANLGMMSVDVGDGFMDPLRFDSSLNPVDSSISTGDIIKNPISGQHFYDLLIQEFLNQGYKEGQGSDATLFTFPYDWRYGISQNNEDALKQKIQSIMDQTGATKVDVVAHSTGGLLVKKYITDNPNHHIGKAVFVGVPNLGAPQAIKVLLQGNSFGIPWLADSEMQKISQNLPVVYDLAPSEQYFERSGSFVTTVTSDGYFGSTKQNLNYDQIKDFLISEHNFNSQAIANAENLHSVILENLDLRTAGVDTYSIVGCKTATLGNVTEYQQKNIFGTTITGYSTNNNVSGDGTVPMSSAQSIIASDNHVFYAIKADHGKMPSQEGIRQEIVNIISGSILDTGNNVITQGQLNQNPSRCALKGHWWQIFSPLSIEAIDQDGNRSGIASDGSIQNDIPGASYEVWGEHKFVFVPTDSGQTYTINLKGTGSGTFTFKDETIDNDQVVNTQVFSDVPVTTALTGNVNISGSTTTLSLDINGDGTTDATLTPSSLINGNESEDLVAPTTTPVIVGTQGKPGFYRSDVVVNFSVVDPVISGQENQTSGVLATHVSVDGAAFADYSSSSPISITGEGPHVLKFFSTDRAGNNEDVQELGFTIDKTAPELAMQFSPLLKDLQFSGTDNISTTSAITVLDQDNTITATDEAGNVTQLTLKSKDRRHQLKADIATLSYNGVAADLRQNILHFDWLFDKKGNLQVLTQQIQSKKNFNIFSVYGFGKTLILGKDGTGKINKTIPSLVLLKVATNKGDLNWSY